MELTSDPALRSRLELVLEARRFAIASGLEPGGAYLSVADSEGLAVAWVVSAAHPDRLEPYLWRYPVVGALPYRGYFDRGRAETFAGGLARRGLDTRVTEVAGYSTLGWFDDPLPSGLLALDDVSLATVVLHEIVHSTLFVSAAVDFNESMATALSERMAVEFFAARPDAGAGRAGQARRRLDLSSARSRFYDELARRLRALFERAVSDGLGPERILEERRAVYVEAAARFEAARLARPGRGGSAFLAGRLDNAAFLAVYRYHRRLGDLHAWLDGFEGKEGWAGLALADLEGCLENGFGPYEAVASRRSCSDANSVF